MGGDLLVILGTEVTDYWSCVVIIPKSNPVHRSNSKFTGKITT